MTLPGDDPGAPWFRRLFGRTVVRWQKGDGKQVPCDVPIEEVILGGRGAPPEVVALYFPPAQPAVDDFSPKLEHLHDRFGSESNGPRLVIVQVVWASNQEPVPWCLLAREDLDRQVSYRYLLYLRKAHFIKTYVYCIACDFGLTHECVVSTRFC